MSLSINTIRKMSSTQLSKYTKNMTNSELNSLMRELSQDELVDVISRLTSDQILNLVDRDILLNMQGYPSLEKVKSFIEMEDIEVQEIYHFSNKYWKYGLMNELTEEGIYFTKDLETEEWDVKFECDYELTKDDYDILEYAIIDVDRKVTKEYNNNDYN